MKPEPFKLERWFARYEFTSRHLLCSSDCESMTIAELLALEPGAAEAFGEHWLGYTESSGDPALREAIAGLYGGSGAGISADQVLVHAGAEEAIFAFMHCALESGDEIVVHLPGYQSLHEVARAIGAKVVPWNADPEAGWSLDPSQLESLIGPRCKAIVINCPHNPTGWTPTHETLEAVIATARKHGLWLFSDEVYRGLEYAPETRLPAACERYERAVSLGVLSKTFGLPGLRIGWVATRDDAIREAMAGFKDYLTICNAAPSEFLARIALKHHRALAARSLEIVEGNLARLDAFFARQANRFGWTRPLAGPIAFAELRGDLADKGAEAFSRDLAEGAGVLLMPATVYDAGDGHVRFGFGRRNLPEALDALEAALV